MDNVSIELVPRSYEQLESEIRMLRQHFPDIVTINIPDLMRYDIRSWQACEFGLRFMRRAIPHLRAIDVNLNKPQVLLDALRAAKLSQVLVIEGDKPQDRPFYETTSIDLIRLLKQEMPALTVYAGIDPYRQGIRDELAYVDDKVEAGADGFFTQPFFDLRLLEVYYDLLRSFTIYWGASPVLSKRSKRYWETKNRAVFPPDFKPTLTWNSHFGRHLYEFARTHNSFVYYMPIRADIQAYLAAIFHKPVG